MHDDFFNYDKSFNTDGDITDKQEVCELDQHIVYCNCRKEAIFTLFDCLALVSILVGFIYMSCRACGQLKTIYLKRHERSLKKLEYQLDVCLGSLLKKKKGGE